MSTDKPFPNDEVFQPSGAGGGAPAFHRRLPRAIGRVWLSEISYMYDATYEMAGTVRPWEDESCYPVDSVLSSWKRIAYILLLLVYSGNPALSRMLPLEPQLIGVFLFLGIMLLRRSKRLASREFLVIAMVFAVLLMIQCIDFSFFPVVTMAGFFIRLFIGYAVFTLVDDFPTMYVRTMVGLALLSLCILVPYVALSSAGISLEPPITRLSMLLRTADIGALTPNRRPLLLHTFAGEFSWRNFGMFWEPGAFQGYLIVALCFLALLKHNLEPLQYRCYFLILCVAVCSTMSTTGYIALVFVIFLHFDWRAENQKKLQACILLGGYVLVPLLLGGSWLAYERLPFLGDKIEFQLNALELRQGRWHCGRIGSLVFDWEYIQERPFTGWGLHSRTRYSIHPWMESSEGMGNGFSDFTAKFGVLGFLTWYLAVLRRVGRLGNGVQTLLVGIILILLLQGECFLAYPFFLGLAFMGKPVGVPQVPEHTLWTGAPGDDFACAEY